MVTALGSVAVAIMFFSYWMEPRSRYWVLTFSLASAATAAYSGVVEAYPITVIEALWSVVAMQRFLRRHQRETLGSRTSLKQG